MSNAKMTNDRTNSKLQITNYKQIQNNKFQILNGLKFWSWNLDIVLRLRSGW